MQCVKIKIPCTFKVELFILVHQFSIESQFKQKTAICRTILDRQSANTKQNTFRRDECQTQVNRPKFSLITRIYVVTTTQRSARHLNHSAVVIKHFPRFTTPSQRSQILNFITLGRWIHNTQNGPAGVQLAAEDPPERYGRFAAVRDQKAGADLLGNWQPQLRGLPEVSGRSEQFVSSYFFG